MLARNWERDQRKISKVFALYRTLRYPVWLISFVEGSRFSSDKIRSVRKLLIQWTVESGVCKGSGLRASRLGAGSTVQGIRRIVAGSRGHACQLCLRHYLGLLAPLPRLGPCPITCRHPRCRSQQVAVLCACRAVCNGRDSEGEPRCHCELASVTVYAEGCSAEADAACPRERAGCFEGHRQAQQALTAIINIAVSTSDVLLYFIECSRREWEGRECLAGR